MASLAVEKRKGGSDQFGPALNNSHTEKEERQRTIRLALLVVPPLVHQRIIDIARLERIQQIQEKVSRPQPRILEAPHRTRLAPLLDLLIRPFDDIPIRDLPSALGETRHRRENVAAHHLPDEAERERSGTVDEVRALNSDHLHPVRFREVDGVVGVFDRLEARERERGFRDAPPDDGAGDDLVERLEEDEAVLCDANRHHRQFTLNEADEKPLNAP